MKGLTVGAGVVAAVLFIVGATPAGALKLNIIVGPADVGGGLYGPAQQCHWEKRQGPCYEDNVCVRRKPNGRCKRIERRRVCETRDVRVCR